MTKEYRNGGITVEGGGPGPGPDPEVILGLDGGTTSTICVCMPLLPFSAHHRLLPDPPPILGRAVAGCSNHNSVGETEARDTLEQVMTEALSKSGSTRSAVRAVCLGVSGVNHPKDQERILNWLRETFQSHVKLYVQNDAVAALASGTFGKLHGCVLIAGTGSISYGFTEDGREARAAGGGPVLGDWGSGYGIAAQALTAVVRAHDGRGQQTMLTNSILKSIGLSSPDELIGWTYADPSWARIAALVPVVVSCAEAGDQIASGILNAAVEELALTVKAVVRRLGLGGEGPLLMSLSLNAAGNGPFPIVMVGGVLEADKGWDIGKELIDCILKDYPRACPIRPKVRNAIYAESVNAQIFLNVSDLLHVLLVGLGTVMEEVAVVERGRKMGRIHEGFMISTGCFDLPYDSSHSFPLGFSLAHLQIFLEDFYSNTHASRLVLILQVEPAVGAALLAWNFLMKKTEGNCHS
ncbi:hypothetical protein RJ639_019768 [Escallonia herrerae]|uniref:N-acetyl-D-glucosamine kinase n=1 Tax=Escallonia herrerae TaxID=1293975 RepID=A0AA88VA95_9ASTE|nr:hypothetical protein RJ639_019768 [Escallonia herrerae]